jgi:ribosomal protein S18 acetylase RimI-like enzyme
MAAITVRRATENDVTPLVALMVAYYTETDYPLDGAHAAHTFEVLLADPALGRVWIAAQRGIPVGYIVLTLGFSLEYGGRDAFVDDLFVHIEARRRGIATALLDATLEEARALGIRALHLEVERSNTGAQRLYERHEFRDNGRQLLTRRLVPHPE